MGKFFVEMVLILEVVIFEIVDLVILFWWILEEFVYIVFEFLILIFVYSLIWLRRVDVVFLDNDLGNISDVDVDVRVLVFIVIVIVVNF